MLNPIFEASLLNKSTSLLLQIELLVVSFSFRHFMCNFVP